MQTGCCPHTAIRDDITANLDAVELLESRHPGWSWSSSSRGGDNLTASLQLRAGRRAGVRHRRRRRGQGAAQGRARGDRRRPARGQQDRPRADGRRRPRRHAPRLRRRAERQADAPDLAARGPDGRVGGRVGARAGAGPGAAARREDASSRSSPGPGPGGRTVLPVVRASGQLAVRRTGPSTVHLVATAFGPLGGDDAEISLVVEEGARLTVRSVAAAVALPARGGPAAVGAADHRVGRGHAGPAARADRRGRPRPPPGRAAGGAGRRRRPHRHRAGAARPRPARSRAAGPARPGSSGTAARCCTPPSGSARARPPGCRRWPRGPMHPPCTSRTASAEVADRGGRRPAAAARRLGDDGVGRRAAPGGARPPSR